jgi:hypothetical protein
MEMMDDKLKLCRCGYEHWEASWDNDDKYIIFCEVCDTRYDFDELLRKVLSLTHFVVPEVEGEWEELV